MATHSAPSSRPGSPTPSLGSDSPSRASVSRGSVPALASSKGPFYRADTTFNPSRARHPQRTLSLYRTSGIPPAAPVGFDIPQATTPPFDGKFVHPPFDNLPDSVVLVNEGMNYSVMHKHPTWFLDINDFITLDASPDSAIRYPRDLEPPRPRRQKDLLLRCTFCPRTYAGVNAKSMWTRHVREKHRVVLSKAWSDTATSSRRQSTGKTAATAGVPGLPTDTAAAVRPSEGSKEKSPLTTVPLAVVAKPLPTPVPKGKPGPKPKPKPPKSVSPVKPPKKVSVTRKIVIPAQKPKPKPKPAPPPPFVMPWVRSLSPPPPEGIRPPRMRPLPRKSIIAGQASIEAAATSLVASVGSTPELNQPSAATAVPTTNGGGVDASELDSIASTPRADTTPDDIAATGASTPSAQFFREPVADHPPDKGSEDEDSIQTDKEVADLLLMDVDTFMDAPDEDVDMELEDEDEGLNPPIALGGLAEPMFGVENDRSSTDLFSLSSRQVAAVFSPAMSPAVPPSSEVSREQSVEDVRDVTPQPTEPAEEEGTPPLGRFKISSLAHLMNKNLSVSPPPSPAPASHRSLTPPPTDTDMRDESSPTATVFATMQDVFVLKMQKMNPELKAKFLEHLQEQFGIEVKAEPVAHGAGADSAPWASLPEGVVRQIMSEHERANQNDDSSTVDALGGELAVLTKEFKQESAVELKDELEEQLKMFVEAFTQELAGPLQEALTLQLKDEIIVQVADQMMDALVVQGEEAQVEFEWRRQFLERQLWAADGESSGVQEDDVIQHPLHHLFRARATPADLDVRAPASLFC